VTAILRGHSQRPAEILWTIESTRRCKVIKLQDFDRFCDRRRTAGTAIMVIIQSGSKSNPPSFCHNADLFMKLFLWHIQAYQLHATLKPPYSLWCDFYI